MRDWRPNTGVVPLAAEGEPPIGRVYVRQRNGHEPEKSWPVDTGRRETTNWRLSGSPFDIIFWRPA